MNIRTGAIYSCHDGYRRRVVHTTDRSVLFQQEIEPQDGSTASMNRWQPRVERMWLKDFEKLVTDRSTRGRLSRS